MDAVESSIMVVEEDVEEGYVSMEKDIHPINSRQMLGKTMSNSVMMQLIFHATT